MVKPNAGEVPSPIGESKQRVDAHEKVTGAAVFADDFQFGEALLHARIKRSPHPHALIKKIDVSKARALPGVKAVVTGEEFPGYIGLYLHDRYIFCRDRVRYVGDPVAGVAAVSEEIAEKALGLIEVEYEVLEPVVDPEAGVSPKAPLIHPGLDKYTVVPFVFPEPGTNISNHFKIRKGDVDATWGTCAAIIERTYRIPHIQHVPIEPHVAIAKVDGSGQITLWGSSQSPFAQRNLIAQALGLLTERHTGSRTIRGRRFREQGRGEHGSPGGGDRDKGQGKTGEAPADTRGGILYGLRAAGSGGAF